MNVLCATKQFYKLFCADENEDKFLERNAGKNGNDRDKKKKSYVLKYFFIRFFYRKTFVHMEGSFNAYGKHFFGKII